ncbi:hypothetical protein G6F46_013978 [Rhizopus delemar]|nr:hypothetical protein G6F22_021580 [Rhizopus arrhizus]KAG1601058.1 hypothetical protein G6F46_013978 [Rhizopus delemar]
MIDAPEEVGARNCPADNDVPAQNEAGEPISDDDKRHTTAGNVLDSLWSTHAHGKDDVGRMLVSLYYLKWGQGNGPFGFSARPP